MSEKGKTRQAKKVRRQRQAARENKAYYQTTRSEGVQWKMPASDREREERQREPK